jgi:hypothetical protein
VKTDGNGGEGDDEKEEADAIPVGRSLGPLGVAEGCVEDDDEGQKAVDSEEAREEAENRGGRRDLAVPEGTDDARTDLSKDAEKKDGGDGAE